MDRVIYRGCKLQVTVRANATHMKLRHRPGQDWIDVTVPNRCPKRDLTAFLDQNMAWIEKELASERQAGYQCCGAAGERAWLLGRLVTLGRDGIPAGDDFLDLRSKALHDEIVRMVPVWQERMKVEARRIRWRDMVSRWGTCKVEDRTITLNVQLGAMPVECIEYVLVHELCHLIHPNHSPAFHDTMTRFMPDWKRRKERLKEFPVTFLPPEDYKEKI